MHPWQYVQAVYKDWVALMSGIASLSLAFLAAYSEFMVRHAKALLWVASAMCFVITSYRVWARERLLVEQLREKLTPTLEVMFGTVPPFIQSHETSRGEKITHYGIQIRNCGASTAKRVRVHIEGFRQSGVAQSVSYFEPTWNRQELSLDPEEKKGIQFVQTAANGRVYLIRTAAGKPLDLGRHDLTIRLLALDLPAREVRAVLEVGAPGIINLNPAD